jgi:hypothetical protein
VRDHEHGLGRVVEDDHAVVEAETQVGDAAVVRRDVGEPLDVADGVVAGVSDRAAAEPRQPRDVRRAVARDRLFEHAQGVGGLGLGPLPAPVARAGLSAARLEGAERAAPEEAVAPDALAADDALEEERPVALLEHAERGDRRERVAGQLPVHGHDGVAARQRGELVEGRTVGHVSLAAGAPRAIVAAGRANGERVLRRGGGRG